MCIKIILQIWNYLTIKKSPSIVKDELMKVLHSAARVLKWKDYKINLNLDTIIGNGFLSVFYKVSLTNNSTKEEIKLAVKKAPATEETRAINAVEFCYKNEILFYTKIYPALQEFEKKHGVSNGFNLAPQYITSVSNLCKEMVVLKDVTYEGFQLRDKRLFLDDEHTRKQEPRKFQALVKRLTKILNKKIENKLFEEYFKKTMQQCSEALTEESDNLVKEKFEDYVLNTEEKFKRATCYHGKYPVLLHGDCWCNNMMFKYKDYEGQQKLEEIMLLDFQVVQMGTPVFDLSYFFYSGVSETLFGNLEQYLDVYYESFTQAAFNLGEQSEDLFSRETLSEEFKKYAKLGVMLALTITKIIAINDEDTVQIIKDMESTKATKAEDFEKKVDKAWFKERVGHILRHVYAIDAL